MDRQAIADKWGARWEQAVRLRETGLLLREIGVIMGVNKETVRKLIKRGIRERARVKGSPT